MKYTKYYMSKNKYPTRVIQGGTSKGGLTVGHAKARRDLEHKLKRKLHDGTKIRTAGGNWVFIEPKSEGDAGVAA